MVEQTAASPSDAEREVIRKTRVGTVVSARNDKTIVVSVQRTARHRLYRKVIRRSKNYHVHDEANEATVGDLVRIEESRPYSRLKRWRLVQVITEREVAEVAPEELDEELVDEVQRSAARAAAEEAEAEEGEVAESEAASPEAVAPAADASESEAPEAEAAGEPEAVSTESDAPEAEEDESDEEKAP
jgi:small subunit ribosomal protein S17